MHCLIRCSVGSLKNIPAVLNRNSCTKDLKVCIFVDSSRFEVSSQKSLCFTKLMSPWQNSIFFLKKGERSVYAGVEKKIEFKLVLWASTFHNFLAQGHFLLVVVNNFVRGWLLSWAVPIGQVISFKNFLPGKKIYLSQTSRQGFFDWSLDNDYQQVFASYLVEVSIVKHYDISISSVIKKQCSLVNFYGMAATGIVTNSQRWHLKVKKGDFIVFFCQKIKFLFTWYSWFATM